ncbi:UV damage repair protein UvrX, partial [Planococcus sp. SIMBA_143]
TVRKINITLSNIVEDGAMQVSLFEPDRWEKRELGYVVDRIRNRYGSGALLRAVSYTEAGTARHRARLVGGHKS